MEIRLDKRRQPYKKKALRRAGLLSFLMCICNLKIRKIIFLQKFSFAFALFLFRNVPEHGPPRVSGFDTGSSF